MIQRWKTHFRRVGTRTLIIGICLLASVLISGAVNEASAAQSTVTLQGFLSIVHGDPDEASYAAGAPHKDLAYLIDLNKHSTLLTVDLALVEPLAGQYVEVAGQTVNATQGQAVSQLQVVSIKQVSAGNAPQFIGLQAVSGSQPWAALLCKYSDKAAVEPKTPDYINTLLTGPYPSLNNYWVENSYGQVNILGSVVTPHWYTLPQPKAYYTVIDPKAPGGIDIDTSKVANDCSHVVDSDPANQIDLSKYVGIHMILNDAIGSYAWGGITSLIIQSKWVNYRITWLPPWGFERQGVAAHETGHGFGLLHSSGPYDKTYDSRWDVMSVPGNCPPPDPNYGCVGVDTIAYHKDSLGWIPASRKYVASPGTSATITIERLDQPVSTTDYLMAQIPIPNSRLFYTVEARKKTGYVAGSNAYDVNIPGEAIIIHQVDPYRGDRLAQVVDPDNNKNPNDAGAMWEPGEIFTDAPNNISVSVISVSDSSFTLSIVNSNVGSPTLTPSATNVPTGSYDTIGVYRPTNNTFYMSNSNSTGFASITVQYGNALTDYPIVGDWTGAGIDTIGIYDQASAQFSLRASNTPGTPDYTLTLGYPLDQPIAGRWSADMTHSGVGVFRPSNGLIYLKKDLTSGFADYTMVLGIPGDVGIAGDWTSQGFDSPGVYRPSASTFFLSDKVLNGSVFADRALTLGYQNDTPIVGVWAAQGHDGVGVFRPTSGLIYLKQNLTTGFAETNIVFGIPGDIPVAGHWTNSSGTGAPSQIIVPASTSTFVPRVTTVPFTTQPQSSYDG